MSETAFMNISPNTAPAPHAVEAAIRQCVDEWIEAVNSFNAEAIAALYETDAVLLATFEPLVLSSPAQRLNYFVNFKARKKLKAAIDECYVAMLGNGAAMANGLYTFRFLDSNEQPQTVQARFTFIYARQPENNWLIVAHHSSVRPVSP